MVNNPFRRFFKETRIRVNMYLLLVFDCLVTSFTKSRYVLQGEKSTKKLPSGVVKEARCDSFSYCNVIF